jgi:hypothetical protein
MNGDEKLALFVMLGQGAARTVRSLKEVAPSESLWLSPSYDLGPLLPDAVRQAGLASEAYRLFFVFETYLRDLVVDVLSKDPAVNWWDKVPQPVKDDVAKLEETEEAKAWMAVGSRDRSALMTYPQLLAVIDQNWKGAFDDVVRDKALVQAARTISHLRNTTCHMSTIPPEEVDRVRQTMRDWFRMVAP